MEYITAESKEKFGGLGIRIGCGRSVPETDRRACRLVGAAGMV